MSVDLSIATAQNTGGAGNDQLVNIEGLFGSSFDDTLKAPSANAYLSAGAGNDTVVSGAGSDYLDGGSGFDLVSYRTATSAVTVDLSITTTQNTGGGGNDTLVGFEAIYGSDYGDTLKGDSVHSVYLAGFDGNDTLFSGAGDDTLFGGTGFNFVSYATAGSGVTVDLSITASQNTGGAGTDTLANFQGVFGSSFNDVLKASGYNSYLSGGAGNDTLVGSGNDDALVGGTGNDTMTGGVGADTFYFTKGDGQDTITDFVAGDAGGDIVDLTGYGISNFSQLQPLLTQSGADTVLQLSAQDQILFKNVTASSLNSGDFFIR